MRGDAAVDHAEYPAHDLGLAREQEAQRVRNTQHPLAHRLLGKHFVHQQRRALSHAPGAAARAEPAPCTDERDQMLGMATVAAFAQEAKIETTAREVVLELLLDMRRQRRAQFVRL